MPTDWTENRLLEYGAALYREKDPDESLSDYREALAAHVALQDALEAQEIRVGVGYDKWTDRERATFVLDNPGWAQTTPLGMNWQVIYKDLLQTLKHERTREAGAVGAGDIAPHFHKTAAFGHRKDGPPAGLEEALDKARRFGGQGRLRRFGKDGKEIKDDSEG